MWSKSDAGSSSPSSDEGQSPFQYPFLLLISSWPQAEHLTALAGRADLPNSWVAGIPTVPQSLVSHLLGKQE